MTVGIRRQCNGTRRRFCSSFEYPGFSVRLGVAPSCTARSRRRLMDILCPRCGTPATPAGHEDGRAFFRCEICNRVWMTDLTIAAAGRTHGAPTRVLVVDDSDQLVEIVAAWLED